MRHKITTFANGLLRQAENRVVLALNARPEYWRYGFMSPSKLQDWSPRLKNCKSACLSVQKDLLQSGHFLGRRKP